MSLHHHRDIAVCEEEKSYWNSNWTKHSKKRPNNKQTYYESSITFELLGLIKKCKCPIHTGNTSIKMHEAKSQKLESVCLGANAMLSALLRFSPIHTITWKFICSKAIQMHEFQALHMQSPF